MSTDIKKMFEINENCSIVTKNILNTNVFIIEDFYKNPEEIVEYLQNNNPNLWKEYEKPSYNSIYFEDRRHFLRNIEVKKVYHWIKSIIKKEPLYDENLVITNITKFKKCKFNDYNNNYWWPHLDSGYTAIIFLNENFSKCGTNLYNRLCLSEPPNNIPEHFSPWRKKEKFELIETIDSCFNRMFLFDAKKIFHGMNICNDDYFEDYYRMNQVLFFKE